VEPAVDSGRLERIGSYIIFPAAVGGGSCCTCSPSLFWYMKVRFELGELVVPVKDQPMACEWSICGEPGAVSNIGERRSPSRPGDGADNDNFRLQFGIISCFDFVLSYSCSV